MRFLADLDHLQEILAYVSDKGYALGVPPDSIDKLELALEEVIVNIFHYAYSEPGGSVDVDCQLERGSHFAVYVRDQGHPFNPLEVNIEPGIDLPLHERKVGGLGIFLMRKLIDEAIYCRESNENVLKLTLRLET